MCEKALKFDNIEVNKNEFHKPNQLIDLSLVDTNKIVISGKFKHINDRCKYFICYKEYNIVRPLCVILPQINGYKKYF